MPGSLIPWAKWSDCHLEIRKDPGQKLAMAGEVRALKGTLDIEDAPSP